MILKDYSLLTLKQFLILLKDYRKFALNHDDHEMSTHLYHMKQYLKHLDRNLDGYITYHQAVKFLVSPYLYDDPYNLRVLGNSFNMSKDDEPKSALDIIKGDHRFSGITRNLKSDAKTLASAHQKVYTPKITHKYVNKSLLNKNKEARILFKYYFKDDFKRANRFSTQLGANYYSTVGKAVKDLTADAQTKRKDINGLNKIIPFIKHTYQKNPKLKQSIHDYTIEGRSPLIFYKDYLRHITRLLKDDERSIKHWQKYDNYILICNANVADPEDIEYDVRSMDSLSMPISYYIEQDLAKAKKEAR